MYPKLNVLLALVAGIAGGALSRYIAPAPVLAQTQPREIRAQSFVFVDDHNHVVAMFEPSPPSLRDTNPSIVLLDRNGKEIWRAGVSAKVLSER